MFFFNPFLCLCAQNCQCCGVCWLPAATRRRRATRRCAWATAWSCRGLPAACWAPILCCFCCAMRRQSPRARPCRRTRPSLWGSCVALSPGDCFFFSSVPPLVSSRVPVLERCGLHYRAWASHSDVTPLTVQDQM